MLTNQFAVNYGLEAGVFSELDYYFAKLIGEQNKELQLLALLVSRAYRFGHTLATFDYLNAPAKWFSEEPDETVRNLGFELLKEANLSLETDWRDIALESPALIKSEWGIYLAKNYQQEGKIVEFVLKHQVDTQFSEERLVRFQGLLDRYFSTSDAQSEIDWQKVAAANSLIQYLSVISGGPGTGKTTTVFKILAILQEAAKEGGQAPLKMVLAAPTGKAAARLTESINEQKARALTEIESDILKQIPSESYTIHRLLGIHPISKKTRYHAQNPLMLDLLVVDEASMIDLQLFVDLIEALPAHARIIFLGDKDQLASVEAGSIMSELAFTENYTSRHSQTIEALTGVSLPVNSEIYPANYFSLLKKSYRFDDASTLGRLAKRINTYTHNYFDTQQKIRDVMEILTSHDPLIGYHTLPIEESVLSTELRAFYQPYLDAILAPNSTKQAIFSAFNSARVLAIQRRGDYGIERLNHLIAKTLFPTTYNMAFYHGLAIMIEENDYEYGLFNGDIGLILEEEGRLRAFFEIDNELRAFSIHSLPQFNHAFAMTVHKSQGSEFERVMLFLAEYESAFLSTELFYTGLTRAKKEAIIFSSEGAIRASLMQRAQRFSAIQKRLSVALKKPEFLVEQADEGLSSESQLSLF